MFAEIELYFNDRQKYLEEINELNASEDENKEKKLEELNSKFKDKIRKYLPACLNIINTTYGCKYSLYKVGKDFDSSFKVIETNVKKSKEEVINELNELRFSIDENNLSQDQKNKLDLVQEILTTYVGDLSKEELERSSMLKDLPAEASSIITNVPVMSEERISIDKTDSNEIQYNPYADMPINIEQENQSTSSNQEIDANSFYSTSIFTNSYPGNNNNNN